MAARRIEFTVPQETYDRIEQARGLVPRAAWIKSRIEPLTDEERTYLEHAIGAGMLEVWGDTGPGGPDGPAVRACRKLGLNPLGWQAQRLLDES